MQKLCDVKPACNPQLIYNSGRTFTDNQMCCSVKVNLVFSSWKQEYFTRMKLRRFTLPVVNQDCHDAFYISKELTRVEYN